MRTETGLGHCELMRGLGGAMRFTDGTARASGMEPAGSHEAKVRGARRRPTRAVFRSVSSQYLSVPTLTPEVQHRAPAG